MDLKYKSWKEITINTYNKLIDAVNNAPETDNETLNNLNKEIAMLAVLCDVDEDKVIEITQTEFIRLVNETAFLREMPKVKITDKYIINGKKYRVFLSLRDMTMNQYIDFQTLYKQRDKYYRELLACFLIPEGCCKYGEGYKIEEVVEDIGNYFSIVDANSIMFFFVLLYQSLTKAMVSYSIKTLKKAMKMEKDKEKREQMRKALAELRRAKDLTPNGNGYI